MYKFTTSKEVRILFGNIFHSFASSTNQDENITVCLFVCLFFVAYVIFKKYFKVPCDGDSIFQITDFMAYVHE